MHFGPDLEKENDGSDHLPRKSAMKQQHGDETGVNEAHVITYLLAAAHPLAEPNCRVTCKSRTISTLTQVLHALLHLRIRMV